MECYEKAVRFDPKSAGAHYNLGNILLAQTKLKDAVTNMKSD